jgi:hypothetical protein
VEASSGEYFISTQGSLAWTLGEVMVETFSNDGGYLTQGFHQPLFVKITELEVQSAVKTFPNPVVDFLKIVIAWQGEFQIELYDLKGVKLLSTPFTVQGEQAEKSLDLRGYSDALYLLLIIDNASGKIFSYRILKN